MNPRMQHLESLVAAGTQDPFVLYALALEYQRDQRMEECLALFDRVLAEHPSYLPAYLMAGSAMAKQGQSERAKAVFEKGILQAQAAGDGHTQGEIEDALGAIS